MFWATEGVHKGYFMKKYSPYILPALVFGVVLLLVFRWYNNRTQPVSSGELFGEGVQIEDLSDQDARSVISGTAKDIKTVQLQSGEGVPEESSAMVRYEIKDDKVRFSVIANMPDDETYTVWLKEVGGTAMREAFTLEMGKGGLVGSAALPANLLPFEVLISTQTDAQDALEQPLYSGIIEQEPAAN